MLDGYSLFRIFQESAEPGKECTISDYWEIMQQIKKFDEQHYKELNVTKIRLLAVYCFASFLLFTLPIVVNHSINVPALLNVFISFSLYFLWYRYYVYRTKFSENISISVGEAAFKLKYPKFLVQFDFKLFAKYHCFCKQAFYNPKTKILYLKPDCFGEPESIENIENLMTDEAVEIQDANESDVGKEIISIFNKLLTVATALEQSEVKEALDQFLKLLAQVSKESLDTQFGRHLINYYLTPLADLLSAHLATGKSMDGEAQKGLLELLRILTSAVQGIANVEELADGNNLSANINAILEIAKLDGLEG